MAIIANLYIDQGTDFSVTVDVTDSAGDVLNLSGYSASAQIRKTYASSTVAASFGTSISEAAGQVTLTLTDTVTAGIEVRMDRFTNLYLPTVGGLCGLHKMPAALVY